MRLFHGTRQHDITALRPSRGGEYGPGVYLTPHVNSAWQYAFAIAQGTEPPLVLEVDVTLPPEKIFEVTKLDWLHMTAGKDRSTVQKKLIKKGFQAILATGLNGYEKQFVLFDPAQATIVGRIHEQVGAMQSTKKTRVSGRALEDIIADPMASAADVKHLARKNRQAALSHPNCPLDLWWELASEYPLKAAISPAGPLFLLEDPERWDTLVRRNASSWIDDYMRGLSSRAKRLFAADCAEHVLPPYEKLHPKDRRPRRAIQALRSWLDDKIVYAAMQKVIAEMRGLVHTLRTSLPQDQPSPAQLITLNVAETALSAVENSPGCLSYAAYAMETVNAADPDVAYQKERVWQWERLLWYLQSEGIG